MDATVSPDNPVIARQRLRTRWLLTVSGVFVVIGLIAAGYWWLYASHYEDTDDSYIAGDLVNVSSQVSGTVVAIDADETDFVLEGQELIRLDDTDARPTSTGQNSTWIGARVSVNRAPYPPKRSRMPRTRSTLPNKG